MQDTLTGKLATVRIDGSSHVVPIWFVLDNQNSKRRRRIGDIIFTPLIAHKWKANNLRRDNRVSIYLVHRTATIFFYNNIWHCKNTHLQTKGGFKMSH